MYRQKLLDLRSKLAYASKGEHSWSFSDRELRDLLLKKPRTIEELTSIKGFPKNGKRVNSFGKQILEIFNSPDRIQDFNIHVNKQGNLEVTTVLARSNSFTKR